MKMRILFVEGNTDGTIGGSYFCLLDLIRRLDHDKYSPVVVFYRPHNLLHEFAKTAQVKIFPRQKAFSFAERPLGKKWNCIRPLLKTLQRLMNLTTHHLPTFLKYLLFARRERIDLIQLNNGPSEPVWTLVSYCLRLKLIAHLRGLPTKSGSPFWICKMCDAIVCVSRSIESLLLQLYPNLTHTQTIYDGLELVPQSDLHPSRRAHDDQGTTLGVVANIKRWKGQHTAIEAVAKLYPTDPTLKLLIIGGVAEIQDDQKYFNELQELVHSLNLTNLVEFTGFRNDSQELIRTLDVLILPSLAPEPFGRVILEAMAKRVPVIATAHGGPVEIIEHMRSGLLVPPNDPTVLAQAISRLSSDFALRRELTKNAYQTVASRFSPETTAHEFSALYANLVFKTNKRNL